MFENRRNFTSKSFSINNVKTGLTIRLFFAKLATLRRTINV